MKLSLEQIRSIVKGCARVVSEEGKIRFLRFTEAQENMYFEANREFYNKTFATAGVRLEFVTDSRAMSLKVDVSRPSSRTPTRMFFNHDIFVDGEKRYALGADLRSSSDGRMTLESSYALGDGEKKVCVYFPYSAQSELVSLKLDDGSSLAPVEHSRKILLFGDSITHGYDAVFPSESYTSLLTDALDAEGCNKGIAGEVFRHELSALPEAYTPDIITVAYGTNDWDGKEKQKFDVTCERFYKNLSALYPTAKIFALAPIWRGDTDKTTDVGAFEYVADKIAAVAKSLPNVTFINCIDFVPHSAEMFSPDMCHPSPLGFSHYAKGLIKEVKKHI